MNTQRGGDTLEFNSYFEIRHNWDGRVVSFTLRPYFSPMEVLWLSGLMSAAGRSIKLVEYFQQPYRESKHEPPFLWGSATTNCAPLAPDQTVRCKMPEDFNLQQQITYPYNHKC